MCISRHSVCSKYAQMTAVKNFCRLGNIVGRLALTIAIGSAAMLSLFLVSGSVKAVEEINRTDDTLAELSQYIAEGHASIRAVVTTPGSSTDAALARFEKAVEARLTRLRSLNNLVERRSGVIIWTRGFHESINVQRLEDARRAYVTAAEVVPTQGSRGGMRMFESPRAEADGHGGGHARQRRDGEIAGALAAEEIVAMSLGFGGLVTAYLIWYPVFRGRWTVKPLCRPDAGDLDAYLEASMRSRPSMYGRSASGTTTVPSFCW
jgi:hypothetical protein